MLDRARQLHMLTKDEHDPRLYYVHLSAWGATILEAMGTAEGRYALACIIDELERMWLVLGGNPATMPPRPQFLKEG